MLTAQDGCALSGGRVEKERCVCPDVYTDVVAVCALHPHDPRETTLSCGVCGRPVCVDCVIHTSVGLRCLACAHGLEVEPSPDEGATPVVVTHQHAHFAVGLGCALAVPWLMGIGAPVIALYELMMAMGLVIHYRIPARELIVGVIYAFVLYSFVLTPLLVAAVPAHTALAHLQLSKLHSSHAAVALAAVGWVGLYLYLLLPARRAARQLHNLGRDFLAGALAGSAILVVASAAAAGVLLAAVS